MLLFGVVAHMHTGFFGTLITKFSTLMSFSFFLFVEHAIQSFLSFLLYATVLCLVSDPAVESLDCCSLN